MKSDTDDVSGGAPLGPEQGEGTQWSSTADVISIRFHVILMWVFLL
jgi:hypothetical protein